jgi:hypothetical protein
MGRAEYTACMTPAMREFPKGISKDERSALFCQAAKLCSGKAKDKAEATALCNQPKPPKPEGEKKHRRAKGATEACPVAVCDVANLIPHCVDVLTTWLPTDIGINPARICDKIFEQPKGK